MNKPITLSEPREAVSTVITGTCMDRSVLNDGNSQKGVDVIRKVLLADDQEAVLELVVYWA